MEEFPLVRILGGAMEEKGTFRFRKRNGDGKGVEDGKGEEKEGATNLAYFEPSQGVTT